MRQLSEYLCNVDRIALSLLISVKTCQQKENILHWKKELNLLNSATISPRIKNEIPQEFQLNVSTLKAILNTSD